MAQTGKSRFGDILRDPLVLALLGTNATINAADSYAKIKSLPDPNTARFVNASMLRGEPVTSLPKEPGIFTSIGKVFGANPDIQASPDAMIQEQLALRQQQQNQEKMALEARGKLGPAGMTAALRNGAFGSAASGMFPGGEVIPTPAEAKASAGPNRAKVMITEHPITSTGEPDYSRSEKRVPSDTASPDAGYMFSTPSRREGVDEAGTKAAVETNARLTATKNFNDNQDARDVTKGGQYYNLETGERPPKGLKVKDLPGSYGRLSDKGIATLNDRNEMNRGFDDLQGLVDSHLVSTKGMSPEAAKAAIAQRQLKIQYGAGFSGSTFLKHVPILNRPTDPDSVALVNVGNLYAIQMLTKMQHRYPNTKELDAAHGILGDMSGMSREVATANIKRARDLANAGVGNLLTKDSGETAGAADDALGDWKSGK